MVWGSLKLIEQAVRKLDKWSWCSQAGTAPMQKQVSWWEKLNGLQSSTKIDLQTALWFSSESDVSIVTQ